ncbi:MAG: S-methyl-5'-thioadenosine phosphorylase [Acidobacteriota bacterium]
MEKVRIGVIGGSGLYAMDGLEDLTERRLATPFGDPSDCYMLGHLDGVPVAFLPRHGRGHRLLPTEVNYRANIFGFKLLGVDWLISVSAVGSLREAYAPGHVVVPDQFFDRTRHRADTFFGEGLVAHVSLADPVSAALQGVLAAAAEEAGATVHRGGTYVCMEGPQFSTRAESHTYRQWGMDIIGMTNLQEARLAREAELSYATLAMVTDYDCWHESEEAVEVEAVLAVLRQNAVLGQETVRRAVAALSAPGAPSPDCSSALEFALVSDPSGVPEATLDKLRPIVGKYFER